MDYILPLGISNFRGQEIKFGIKLNDRLRHIYIIGKTGQGKTTLLENMIVTDILNGSGLAYLDPHGDSIQKILDYIPKERIADVIYFNPADIYHPIGFNPLEKVSPEHRHLTALSLLGVFKKIWVDAWSARMEYILTNTLLALLDWPSSTLLDVNRMLADENFRKKVVANLKDEVVKSFWLQEFGKYHLQFRTEAIAPIQNKIGQFITNPLIRNIIGQETSAFDLREIMDGKKIFLANLSVGAIGEETASLLGGLLITKFQLASMSRVNIPEEERKPFFLYIDEFQNFSTESFANILSEARKYRLSLILAHQYLDQVPESIIKAIFGNVGTFIIFRIGPLDAEIFVKELGNTVNVEDLINLPSYHIYIKLLIDGQASYPFSAITLPPQPKPTISYRDEIINFNHLQYAKRKSAVENKIARAFREVQKEGEIIICQQCKQEFFSTDYQTICNDCQDKVKKGISLKEAINKEILVEKRKKEEEISLDSILKKLSNES
ncbi:MAG: type IV secretion system DNA-binding domain-containing protein [Patescibacteria group bacterium]|nr:type IV secretion system DNA-binding domain-containing protein [Patescibacteria group bacterium]